MLLYHRADEMLKKGVESKNDYDNAKLNADAAQAKYDQALAAVEQNEAQCASAAAAQEGAKATLQQVQADLDRAKLNLEYTNIYSPVDGVVIARSIDVGQTIAASLQAPTLFSIANDLSQMQVNASVDEADIGNVSAAEDVKFTVDAYPNDVFHAKIAEVRLNPQSVQNVVTYSVILSINNKDMKLRPGMTATITFTVDQREDVLKIPNAALRYTPAGQTRPDPGKAATSSNRPDDTKMVSTGSSAPSGEDLIPLAPGQKWDPARKIQFAAAKKLLPHPGFVWVLDEQKQPVMRKVVLGITDGASTEVVSGDVKPGEAIIVGDSTTMGSGANGQRGFFGGSSNNGNGGGQQSGGGQRQ
jgi:HlyD family secretion protein